MKDKDLQKLIGEIKELAKIGKFPDGDIADFETSLWAERWWERIDSKEYFKWLKDNV